MLKFKIIQELNANNEIFKYSINYKIKNLIYTIRGKQVMLDSDVAMLYHYETKNVNKAVKRNIDRFPEEFRGGRRYLPYVFTEQGIAMLKCII